MGLVHKFELAMAEESVQLAQMMACMSILSNVQEMIDRAYATETAINEQLNHAKLHLLNGMMAERLEKKLTGDFITNAPGSELMKHMIETEE